ncbi:DNA polymerase LigD, ligase domain protein [Mycobacterium parascrofulaceum ATCC BAA-614]|uniref:DNA ligase (ATP) n=2 Tax=Mycobacterium parascrofulaceum TaxID=240125 RepID=D5P2G9_9MYCO|nr:DNA polymerase LigD, ligase domain protein [Mycobacterium parascrofulaceum ATCC BAA-614]
MLAMAGQPPCGPEWVVEPKFDGARCAARVGAGRVDLFSRHFTNLSASFPEVMKGCTALGRRGVILDGEIIVLDDKGRPSFELLQRRLRVARPPASLTKRLAARLVVFDILYLDGQDLTGMAYRDRRAALQALGADDLAIELATSPAWSDVDGAQVLAAMVDAGMEGIVSKDVTSRYRVGRRTRQWIKTPHRCSNHFLIGGYTLSRGSSASVGSVLVGAYDPGGVLAYCGRISVGLGQQARRDLHARLSGLHQTVSPFGLIDHHGHDDGVLWVRPVVVGRIEYREFVGGRLRHAAWKGVADVNAGDVCLALLG